MVYLESRHPGAGGDGGVFRRQRAYDLMDKEALAGASSAGEEYVLTRPHLHSNKHGIS